MLASVFEFKEHTSGFLQSEQPFCCGGSGNVAKYWEVKEEERCYSCLLLGPKKNSYFLKSKSLSVIILHCTK